MIGRIAALISSGFGSGYAPKAPGTFGSVAAALLWLTLERVGAFSHVSPLVLALMVSVVGLAAVSVALLGERSIDPQWIVIDEWAGLFVALCGVDLFSFGQVVIALVGFRLFDIVKPGPVAWAERLPGAIGVMADDIVAGGLVLLGFVVCGVI
jgi:phosphatidylglycerophosphatase A